MSYRSFKRLLGESSLERKCLYLFGACLFLLIFGSFWFYGRQTENLVELQNRNKGALFVEYIVKMEHVKQLEKKQDPEFADALMGVVDGLMLQEYNWRFIRRDPENKDAPQDEEEWSILEEFEAADPEEKGLFHERRFSDKSEYRYYQPIYAKTKCVGCHRALQEPGDLKEGDLIAVVQVAMNDEQTQRARNFNQAILISTAIVTASLAMLASYIIVRYVIVKPLKHLRDVSNEIRRGRTDLRAEIRTGDEFEELSVAFNRMLRHLVAVQEELRRVNSDLDGKVDELAQLNMQLFEMNRLKNDFLATMSHELRTPLNSIIGFSEVLNSINSLDDKQKRYVENISKSGKILLDMINDILDLAKIESGKMEVRLGDFPIEHVVGALCDMARPLSERKNIDLEVYVEPNLPKLRQDQGKVQQILNNLLSNAIKFTPEGGRISVQARRDISGALIMTVSDTGVGIAEEDRVQIFEKFRQGQSAIPAGDTMTREHSGTGLGLSIVKELCKLLGGEISLESELGKGSTFTVTLPWSRSERPKLESPVSDSLEELTKPRRIDFERAPTASVANTAAYE